MIKKTRKQRGGISLFGFEVPFTQSQAENKTPRPPSPPPSLPKKKISFDNEKIEKNTFARNLGFKNHEDRLKANAYARSLGLMVYKQKETYDKYVKQVENTVLKNLKNMLTNDFYEEFMKEYTKFKKDVEYWEHFQTIKNIRIYENKLNKIQTKKNKEAILYRLNRQTPTLRNSSMIKQPSLPVKQNYPTLSRSDFYNLYINKAKKSNGLRLSKYYNSGQEGYYYRAILNLVINVDGYIHEIALNRTLINLTAEQLNDVCPDFDLELKNIIEDSQKLGNIIEEQNNLNGQNFSSNNNSIHPSLKKTRQQSPSTVGRPRYNSNSKTSIASDPRSQSSLI